MDFSGRHTWLWMVWKNFLLVSSTPYAYLQVPLESYQSAETNEVVVRCFNQILQTKTWCDDQFALFIPSQRLNDSKLAFLEFKTTPNSRPIELHEAEKNFLVLQNVSNKNSRRRLRSKVYFDTTYMCIQCKLKIFKNLPPPPPNMGGGLQWSRPKPKMSCSLL